MTLQRLASTTQRPTPESIDPARRGERERIRRVESMEGTEGDRERSLRQELAEIDPGAIAEFAGHAQMLHEASEVAAQLVAHGAAIDDLIKPGNYSRQLLPGVDDSV
ncbi:hypothetical protein LZ012_00615 [Dechloromonas sp. XY25]|uniref:Uncharacterized protein n=1 Tax=Dechloromonas hankyongensis TaxID=2908002 RepID=A0ABS9JX47_9RHOO|nr:hypothetical protein [Dechloromonas hankyongensis]MCG2575490.1 hypothetical protein [Dechloromonas hankyongensis]